MATVLNTKEVFVGSSTEGKPFAEAVIGALQEAGFSPLPWFDFFKTQDSPLQQLERLSSRVAGAVLVASADDRAIIRGTAWRQARDNVLFEYGLFAGALGRPKCGLILPDSEDFRIPSDFLGVACFQTYGTAAISSVAKATATALAGTLRKPQPEQTTQVRARRILLLIGWIRDESLRIIQDWDRPRRREVVGSKIIGVAGFIREDLHQLSLQEEYEKVERVLLEAIHHFPDLEDHNLDRGRMRRELEDMLCCRTPPEWEVFQGVSSMLRHSQPARSPGRNWADRLLRRKCEVCHCPCWEDHGRILKQAYFWSNQYFYPPSDCIEEYLQCGRCAYALGVAQAVTAFGRMSDSPLKPFEAWSGEFVPRLNDAVGVFERKLHEQIFGAL